MLDHVHKCAIGYKKYFKRLSAYLLSPQSPVADKIEVIPLKDRGTTGNFEVTVKSTGQVLHSKRNAGQGRAETEAEKVAILEQIEALVATKY